jgi:hypothetical protein
MIVGKGYADTRREDRGAYNTTTFQAIVELAQVEQHAPPCHNGKDHWWVIPHDFTGPDGRSFLTLYRDNIPAKATALWADFDRGDPTFEQVLTFAKQVAQGCQFLLYTTRSNGEVRTEDDICPKTGIVDKAGTVKRKYRVIWDVEPFPLQAVQSVKEVICAAAEQAGLVPDWSASRPCQLCYLPNRGPEYQFHHQPGQPIAIQNSWMYEPALERLEHTQRADYSGERNETERSPRRAFAVKHPTAELLAMYGFETRNGDDWHHPGQSTKSYGTKVDDDGRGWVTASEYVENLLGRKNGDGFDLFVALQHGGDEIAAFNYAKQCLKELDEAKYGTATSEHGSQLWNGLYRIGSKSGPAGVREDLAKSAETLQEIKVAPIDDPELQWDIGWPPGLVGEVAKWIYTTSRRPVSQFAIAQAFYVAAGILGARYNIDGSGVNLYMVIAGDSGVGKGESQRRREALLAEAFKMAQDPAAMIDIFGHDVAASAPGLRKMFSGDYQTRAAYKEDSDALLNNLTASAPDSNGERLRAEMSKHWDKSGRNRVLGSVGYAKDEHKINAVVSPAYTVGLDTQIPPVKRFLGTPAVTLGFAQRFLYFMYEGPAFKPKRGIDASVPQALAARVAQVYRHTATMGGDTVHDVHCATELQDRLEDLEDHYIDLINKDKTSNDIFNRAQAQVSRLAALMAAMDNPENPVISPVYLDYAETVAAKSYGRVSDILLTGEAGGGESVRAAKVIRFIEAYTQMTPAARHNRKCPKCLDGHGDIIPEVVLVRGLRRDQDFKGTDQGRTTEDHVRKAVQELVLQSYLVPVTASELAAQRGIVIPGQVKTTLFMLGDGFQKGA